MFRLYVGYDSDIFRIYSGYIEDIFRICSGRSLEERST